MTPALLVMDGIAAMSAGAGAVLLMRSRRQPRSGPSPAAYGTRLSGAMLLALGLILFAFSTAYALATRS